MSQTEHTGGRPIALSQLLALNDEMAALVRAGIPLDRGLAVMGHESPGKLGTLASGLADRLRSGENLTDIVQRDDRLFPPVWRSVVLAGIRAGQLAAALEGLSQTVRRAAEARRSIAVSLIYPCIVVGVAYVSLLLSATYLAPVLTTVYHDLVSRPDPVIALIERVCVATRVWAPWVPLLLGLGLLWWWCRSGRAIRSAAGSARGRSGRFLFGVLPRRWPTVSQVLRDGRMATFAELLRLMNDHQVPMPEAMVLAADASGDRMLSRGAREVAECLERGAVLRSRSELPDAFPPLLAWSIVTGAGQTGLSRALATSAAIFGMPYLIGLFYVSWLLALMVGGVVAIVCTLVEAMSPWGIDNLTVPAAAGLLLNMLLG